MAQIRLGKYKQFIQLAISDRKLSMGSRNAGNTKRYFNCVKLLLITNQYKINTTERKIKKSNELNNIATFLFIIYHIKSLIFYKMVYEIGWCIISIEDNFFEKNYKFFPNFGGDMETLLFKCKIEHSKRIFCLPIDNKKRLTKEDINDGFNEYKLNVKIKKTDNTSINHLYL